MEFSHTLNINKEYICQILCIRIYAVLDSCDSFNRLLAYLCATNLELSQV